MQSVLVGRDLNGCAFVYGSLSFMDKMICGVALFILESYQSKYLVPNLSVISVNAQLQCKFILIFQHPLLSMSGEN